MSDTLRPEAAAVVQALHKSHGDVWMVRAFTFTLALTHAVTKARSTGAVRPFECLAKDRRETAENKQKSH